MEIMISVTAVLFGLSAGTLLRYTTIPRVRPLPFVAALIVLVAGILAFLPATGAWSSGGVLFAIAALVGLVLSGGVFWADHPALAGEGFMARAMLTTQHGQRLREAHGQTPDANDDPAANPQSPIDPR